MNIVNYSTYFHDGSLINTLHNNDRLVLSMESAQISTEEKLDNIILYEDSTIKGKLHLDGIELIIDGNQSSGPSHKFLPQGPASKLSRINDRKRPFY